MIVQKQLGYNKKPVILLNTKGFYNGLVNFFDSIIAHNFAKEETRNLYYVAESPEDAFRYLQNYNPADILLASKF